MTIGPVMLDLEGTVLTAEEEELLRHPLVGGVIYFARNYQSPSQIKSLTESIRSLRPELLLAVDQEGGRVQRFREGFTRLPPVQQFLPLFRRNPDRALSLVRDVGWLMASEVLTVGVDFSFAPVLDLDDQHCEVIANRSFSPDATEAVALAGAWMAGMHEAGMATTGKHFPGHGAVRGDSHLQLPVDNRELSAIADSDLRPFVELRDHLDAIMPAHILFPAVDQRQPVGFSHYWLQTILRGELQYPGVIFSDDLGMAGAAGAGSFVERARLALEAGCDMVLVCNQREGVREILASLVPGEREESERRLAKMRARGGLDHKELIACERWRLTRRLLGSLVCSL